MRTAIVCSAESRGSMTDLAALREVLATVLVASLLHAAAPAAVSGAPPPCSAPERAACPMVAACSGGSPQAKQPPSAHAPFVANVGQADEAVAFYARTPHGTLFVTENGELVYALESVAGASRGDAVAIREVLSRTRMPVPTASLRAGSTVERVGGRGCGRAVRAATCEVVELGEIADGIRARLCSRADGVEKIFIVSADADPDDIAIAIDGATALATDSAGRLVVSTALGEVRFTRPVAYQEMDGRRVEVEADYTVTGAVYGFEVGEYDRGRELIIDPLLASTFLGGSGGEGGYCGEAVALAPDGTVYVTGYTTSIDFPTTIGEPYHGGASDVFVSRFDSTLTNLLTSIYLGGSDEEQASCIAVDAAGKVYISGGTLSDDFPATTGAYDETYGGGAAGPYDVPGDVFVAKLSADLATLEACTYFGGVSFDYSRAIVVDGSGVHITGATASSGLATPGAFDETRDPGGDWGGIDAYVASFDATLSTLTACTYLGGNAQDYSEDMAGSAAGLYVTGWTQSGDYPTSPAAFDTLYADGVYDAFVTGVDASLGSLVGSTYLGGTSWDFGYAIATDAAGNVYVTGHNAEIGAETTFPTTDGAYQTEYNGIGGANVGDDAFVSKFDPSLSTLVASTMFGGTGWEYGTSLKWDPDGYICLAGTTTSDDIPRHAGAWQYDYAGDDAAGHSGEGFVSRLTDDLTSLDASTFLGGSGNDWPECLVLDADANAYVAGSTTSSDFPSMHGSYEEDWQGGGSDAFVSVLSSDLGSLSLTAGPQYGLPPLSVSLDGAAPPGAAPDDWVWDVDDDGSPDTTGQNVQWTYEAPGTYTVRLKVHYGAFSPSVALENGILVFDESSALAFDGSDARAVCAASPEIDLAGDITLEAWVNPYDWGGFPFGGMGFGQVVSKGPVALHLVGTHSLYNDSCLCLAMTHGDGTSSVSYSGVGSMALDAWQHVAASYDTTTSTVRMWIDGVEQVVDHYVAPSGGIANGAADDLLIGNFATLNKGFEGVIDEVRVWGVARDPEDVISGRDYPLFGDEAGLIGYWRMDEATGDLLGNGVSGGPDATRVGAGWVQGIVLHATGADWSGNDAPAEPPVRVANCPNPFSPGTTVSFVLPAEGPVHVAVYDVAGRLVRTLADGHMEEGPAGVVWDGTTDAGVRAASGVYFCRLTTTEGSAAAMMVLIR